MPLSDRAPEKKSVVTPHVTRDRPPRSSVRAALVIPPIRGLLRMVSSLGAFIAMLRRKP